MITQDFKGRGVKIGRFMLTLNTFHTLFSVSIVEFKQVTVDSLLSLLTPASGNLLHLRLLYLTHFFLMFPFLPPENGYKNVTLGRNRLMYVIA